MDKLVSIRTDDNQIYKHILALMNFGMNLTDKEIEVLAEFVRLNNDYEALEPIMRAKFIFSTDMRKEIMEKLQMEESSFNNILSRLRKATFIGKPVLSKENVICEDLLCKPRQDGYTLTINLIKGIV
jgi:predicted transcriptional regulator